MRNVLCALTVLGLSFAASAAAAGPQLGSLQGGAGITDRNGATRYVVVSDGTSSIVEAVRTRGGRLLRFDALDGAWGIPTVTLQGQTGGLSRDGRLLVLSDATPPSGTLRTNSTFLVIATNTLTPDQVVELRGDFAFDALSADSRTLYLIQHVSATDITSYRVRAYDLAQNRLLPASIADKRQVGWTMSGYPAARATSSDGRWVYTLYEHTGGYPFVHALDTAGRSAVCIGLPWQQRNNQNALAHARMRLDDHELTIAVTGTATRFTLDTRTLRLLRPQRRGTEAFVPGAAAAAVVFLVLAGLAVRRRRLRTDV